MKRRLNVLALLAVAIVWTGCSDNIIECEATVVLQEGERRLTQRGNGIGNTESDARYAAFQAACQRLDFTGDNLEQCSQEINPNPDRYTMTFSVTCE